MEKSTDKIPGLKECLNFLKIVLIRAQLLFHKRGSLSEAHNIMIIKINITIINKILSKLLMAMGVLIMM